MESLPNQEALNRALNYYRSSMRNFIISNLRKTPGEKVEDLILHSLHPERVSDIEHKLENSDLDIKSIIDINDFPHVIHRNWEQVFNGLLSDDKSFRNQLWIIKEGRNQSWAHPPEGDADTEGTRAFLFIIAEVLEKINIPEARSNIEKIRDELIADNTATQLSKITEEMETEKSDKKKLKKEYETAVRQIEELENQCITNKTDLEEANKHLLEAKDNRKKTEGNLSKARNDIKETKQNLKATKENLKAAEEAWIEVDKLLKSKMAELQKVEDAKNIVEKEKKSIEEKYDTLKSQFEEANNGINEYEIKLTSIENQLLAAKTEKSYAEERIATLANPVYPSLNSDSDVFILDRRETDRKQYIINLLETKRPSIIYVHDSEKINQLSKFVGDVTAASLGVHNNRTSVDDEKELLSRLENGDINAIVTDSVFTSLPEQHSVEHFIVCHPVLCLDEFVNRCKPVFNGNKVAYIHLIYDSTQDFQDIVEELEHKYLDKEVLKELYVQTKKHITANKGILDLNSLYQDLDLEKSGISTGLDIFEELGFIERNAENTKITNANVKRELEDSYLYCEGKRLKEKVNRESFQIGKDPIETIWDKIQNTLLNENKEILPEQDSKITESPNGSQQDIGIESTNDRQHAKSVDIPKKSRSKVTVEQVREIRKRAADGESLSYISKEYGMSSTGIWNIVNRNTWKDVE